MAWILGVTRKCCIVLKGHHLLNSRMEDIETRLKVNIACALTLWLCSYARLIKS